MLLGCTVESFAGDRRSPSFTAYGPAVDGDLKVVSAMELDRLDTVVLRDARARVARYSVYGHVGWANQYGSPEHLCSP